VTPPPPRWHLAGLLLGLGGALFASRHLPVRSNDELVHLEQVGRFLARDFSLVPDLSMIPGFHVLAALFAAAFADPGLATLRAFNVLAAMLSVLVVYDLVKRERLADGGWRLCLVALCPVAAPYFVYVFTDTLSLLLALVMLWLLVTRPATHLAALVAVVNILVRQTNVVWLLFVVLYPVFEAGVPTVRSVPALLRQTWVAILGLIAFAVFVVVNGGVAVGDGGPHELELSLGNLWFFLFLLFVLWLPLHASALWLHRRRLFSPWLAALLAVAFAAYWFGFRITHSFNYTPNCLHNDLLHALQSGPVQRLVFFAAVAGGICALWVTPMRRRSFLAWYPVTALALLPSTHIEHRYYIVPMALFLLLRQSSHRLGDVLTCVLDAAIVGGLMVVVVTRECFL